MNVGSDLSEVSLSSTFARLIDPRRSYEGSHGNVSGKVSAILLQILDVSNRLAVVGSSGDARHEISVTAAATSVGRLAALFGAVVQCSHANALLLVIKRARFVAC